MDYQRKQDRVQALQLKEACQLRVGPNFYKGASGDWLVQFEDGRLAVMPDKRFSEQFEPVPAELKIVPIEMPVPGPPQPKPPPWTRSPDGYRLRVGETTDSPMPEGPQVVCEAKGDPDAAALV